MNNIEKLRECPFCGKDVYIAYGCGTAHHIECRNNACVARVTFKDRTDKGPLRAAWNRRAYDAEIAALRAEKDAAVRERDAAVNDIGILLAYNRGEDDRLCVVCAKNNGWTDCEECISPKWRGLADALTRTRRAEDMELGRSGD